MIADLKNRHLKKHDFEIFKFPNRVWKLKAVSPTDRNNRKVGKYVDCFCRFQEKIISIFNILCVFNYLTLRDHP